MNTVQITINIPEGETRELLIAQLSEAGCEGFEEKEDTLLAFWPEDQFDESDIRAIAGGLSLSFEISGIAPQNWNAAWESSFEPVIVPGFCTVRAAFHPPATDTPYEVVITPKMSFGTGHHATTRLMMQAMRDMNIAGGKVLDFGTGTGILAILAALLGAKEVLAIDNDAWSVENAVENVANNGAKGVIIRQGSLEAAGAELFDVILANINRHILLEYMPAMKAMLNPAGKLLLSGILLADKQIITASATEAGLLLQDSLQEGDWLAMKFTA